MEQCLVDGCNREIYLDKHGLCRAHYERYRRKGDPGDCITNRGLIPYREIHAKKMKEAKEGTGE